MPETIREIIFWLAVLVAFSSLVIIAWMFFTSHVTALVCVFVLIIVICLVTMLMFY